MQKGISEMVKDSIIVQWSYPSTNLVQPYVFCGPYLTTA